MSGLVWEELVDCGDLPPLVSGRPKVGLFNANPFARGIANLGAQAVARYLIDRGINVYFAFADTMAEHDFLNDDTTRAAECDVIGISIPFEDTYLDVLRMMAAAGLPTASRHRGDAYPLVVAGGLAMINPLPIAQFVDAVVLGDGRRAFHDVVLRYSELRRRGVSKREALFELSEIPGVYVPEHYEIEIDATGCVAAIHCANGHAEVEAAATLNPADAPVYSEWTSRLAVYEHSDYFSMMAALGCSNKCPFCVVGHVQGSACGRPLAMSVDQAVDLAVGRRRRWGTSLIKPFFPSAFSSKEHTFGPGAIKELLEGLLRHGFRCRVGSLNVRQADLEVFELLHALGQREVTFAPETSSDQRFTIGKAYISDQRLYDLMLMASKFRFDVNLYCLGCLPGETDADTASLASLLRSLRRALSRPQRMCLHYNPVFMKAQTPYQYFGNTRPAEARRKYSLLRSYLSGCEIDFVTAIDSPLLYSQAVLSVGDSNAGEVLAHLFRRQHLTEHDWVNAFRQLNLSDNRYFTAKPTDRQLPWEHLKYSDVGRLRARAAVIASSEMNACPNEPTRAA